MTIGATAITVSAATATGSRKRLESGTEVSFEISIGVEAPVYPHPSPAIGMPWGRLGALAAV
jgi:hypothetical protein